MKKIFLLIGFFLLSLACTSCATEVVGITISSQDNLRTVAVGKTLQLSAVVYPEGADQSVVWTTEDGSIATVDDKGLVLGVSMGKTNIIATSKVNSNVSQSFSLIVEDGEEVTVNPESITISSANGTSLKAGEKLVLTATVLPQGASQNVTWSTSDASIATVSRGEVSGLKEGEVVITAACKNFPEITSTITLTVTAPARPEVSADWAEMSFSSHNDYVSCEDDTKIKIKGVVTHVTPIKENLVNYFIQNGNDGYYVYGQDAILYPVEAGKVYEVGGYKKYYRGLNEIVNVAYCVESTDSVTFNYISLNDKNPSSLDGMKVYQGAYVTGDASFVSGSVNEEKAYSLTVKVNNVSTTLRVDPSYMSVEEFAAINAKLKGIVAGTELSFKGFMTAFGYGTPANQIQVVKASDVELAAVSDEDVLNASLESLVIDTMVGFSKNTITLPTSIDGFDGIVVSWASDSSSINVTTGAVTHCESSVEVTLTATLKLNETTITKQFIVTVAALDNKTYTTLVSFDLEDAAPANQYGCSDTKPGYAEGNVTLGTPKYSWLLRNALIANSSSDKFEGTMGIRAKAGSTAENTARIEVLTAGEYNVVEFAAAVYGNHQLGTKIQIEYTTDNGATWQVAETVITLNSHAIETFRVFLPEGVKRVAIVVVENSGKTVNIDSIKLMK